MGQAVTRRRCSEGWRDVHRRDSGERVSCGAPRISPSHPVYGNMYYLHGAGEYVPTYHDSYTLIGGNGSPQSRRDQDTSAYLRLQAEVERHSIRLSQSVYTRGSHWHGRYGVGEMLSPNHKGWGTGGGSHGDDTDSDGASLAGPQPYEGDKQEFPRCVAGSLRVRVGTEGRRSPESDGRIPRRLGRGGGQYLPARL